MHHDWDKLKDWFLFDGSWRDIYVLDTRVSDWQSAIEAIRRSSYAYTYTRFGESDLLPDASEIIGKPNSSSSLLEIDLGGLELNCHFFCPIEIEFDLDPRQVCGQHELDALLAFMRLLAHSTKKDVLLCDENASHLPRLVVPS